MYLMCLITYFTKYFTPSAVYASSQPKGKPMNKKVYKIRTEKSGTFTLHEDNKQDTGEVWSQNKQNSIATFLADPLDPERPVTVRISWQMGEMGS